MTATATNNTAAAQKTNTAAQKKAPKKVEAVVETKPVEPVVENKPAEAEAKATKKVTTKAERAAETKRLMEEFEANGGQVQQCPNAGTRAKAAKAAKPAPEAKAVEPAPEAKPVAKRLLAKQAEGKANFTGTKATQKKAAKAAKPEYARTYSMVATNDATKALFASDIREILEKGMSTTCKLYDTLRDDYDWKKLPGSVKFREYVSAEGIAMFTVAQHGKRTLTTVTLPDLPR